MQTNILQNQAVVGHDDTILSRWLDQIAIFKPSDFAHDRKSLHVALKVDITTLLDLVCINGMA